MKLTTRLLAAGALALAFTAPALADGMFSKLPVVGGAAYCALYAGDGTTCVENVPAGPPTLTGNERVPADTKLPNGNNPQTVLLQGSLIANGFGGTTIATTTGTTAAVVTADAISTYIYAGAGTATYTSFKLPPNPAQNQKFCLVNAGSGVLTLTAVAVGTSGQSIVGTAPTSLPVATAVGTAGTVTLSSNCWLYNVSNTSWYRIQ